MNIKDYYEESAKIRMHDSNSSKSAGYSWGKLRENTVRMVDPQSDELILDAGTGTGDNIINLVKTADCTFVGLEISRTRLGLFKRRSE